MAANGCMVFNGAAAPPHRRRNKDVVMRHYASATTAFLQAYTTANITQLRVYRVGIALMPYSGTPFPHGLYNALPFYEKQRAE